LKANDQEKARSLLANIKSELVNFKKDNKHSKKISYPASIKERVKALSIEGVSDNLVHQMTGIPLTTIYGWNHVKNKKKKIPKGFRNLIIAEDPKPANCKSDGEILVTLSNDIKLTVPLSLMVPMIQILKEQWHVSRS
jgi:hypothetical protein